MDQIGDRHFSFWRGIISTYCRLYKPLPSSAQAYIHDRPTHSKPIQTDMLRIWMAWNQCQTMAHVMLQRSSPSLWLNTMSITSQACPINPQSNGLAEKYVQIVKNMFYKAKEEGKDLHKCLMVYCNTPLSSNLQSPMQILASRSARSNLPMSNAARKQKGSDCEHLRTQSKNEQVLSHDLHLDQVVMYQDP